MRSIITSLLLVACLFKANSQSFTYFSYSAYGEVSALGNYRYIALQPQPFYGGGLDLTFSFSENVNGILGVQYMESELNLSKEPFSTCEFGQSCWIDSKAQYVNIPLGIEIYQNVGKIKTVAYYHVKLFPMFSLKEAVEKTEVLNNGTKDVKLTNEDGFKFQDLHLGFSFGTEFYITKKFKIFAEPSIRHSVMFKKEDFVNPNYVASLKVGVRLRTFKR